MLDFPGERSAFLNANWITPKKFRRFSFVMSDGILDGDFLTQEVTWHGPETSIAYRPPIYKHEPLKLELADFVEAIQANRSPRVTGEQAYDVARVTQAIVDSAGSKKPVGLESD